MAKTKTPFFGLGAHGTVGGVITAQKRAAATMVRVKPTPAYRRTLPQQYQRWLYQDYAYLWTQQSEATRRAYAADGVRFHLTGFQYWMKYNLLNMPDIRGMWYLDEKAGLIAHDSGRQANNGTIFGAIPTDGLIDGAQSFDGINDHISVPHAPSLDVHGSDVFTILMLAKQTGNNTYDGVFTKSRGVWYELLHYGILHRPANAMLFNIANDATKIQVSYGLPIDIWYAWAIILSPTQLIIYRDAVPGAPIARTINPLSNTEPLEIGQWTTQDNAKVVLDHIIFYNRVLDQTEISMHLERRYPS